MNVQLIFATALILCGIGLLIAGVCITPVGIIDSSILIAFGEISTFAGALTGVDYHYRYKQ